MLLFFTNFYIMLISSYVITLSGFSDSSNSTIERDVRRVEATLQEATASMQLRPVSDSPAQLMDLARRAPDRLTDGQASKLTPFKHEAKEFLFFRIFENDEYIFSVDSVAERIHERPSATESDRVSLRVLRLHLPERGHELCRRQGGKAHQFTNHSSYSQA